MMIIAIVCASGCKLAYPFIKNAALYPKHVERPKIYSQLAEYCCKPAHKTTKHQQAILSQRG
jgi:hypothetical protein